MWIDKVDGRFCKENAKRVTRCDRCRRWFRGNDVGAFLHTHKPPPLHMRLVARRARRWDATWYCVDCQRENDESEEEVEKRLGMTKRMSAKMSYLYGGEPCDQRHYRSMLHVRERPRSHQCGHRSRDPPSRPIVVRSESKCVRPCCKVATSQGWCDRDSSRYWCMEGLLHDEQE